MREYKSFRSGWLAVFVVWCGLFLLVPAGIAQNDATTGADEIVDADATTDKPAFDASQFTLSIRDWAQFDPGVALGTETLRQGDVEQGTKQYVTAVADNPALPQAEILLAEFYFASNKKSAGFASLEQAVKNFPNDPEPYLVLGNLAWNEQRFTDARLLFEKAATLADDYEAVDPKKRRITLGMYAGLSLVEEKSKAWTKAIPYLQNWLKADPKNPAAHLRLARALFHSKRGKEAYAEAQKPSQLNPKFAKADLLIAQFYSEADDEKAADQWRARAEKKYPNDHTTRIILADRAWKSGDLEVARRHATTATKLDDASNAAFLLAGMASHASGDYAAAEDFFRQAQKLAPNDFTARNHLAMVLAVQEGEKVNEALRLAQANRRDFPNSHIAVATLGFVQFQLGQREEAFKNYQLAAKSGPGTGDIVYFFARYWDEDGNSSEALRLLDLVRNNKTMFVFRRDAEALHDKLKVDDLK